MMSGLFFKNGKKRFILVIFILTAMIFVRPALADIVDQFNLFVSKDDYAGCIAFLEDFKSGAAQDDLFVIEYHSALAKSLYLDHLEQGQAWEEYYEKVDRYNQDIISIAYKYAGQEMTALLIDLQRLAQKAHLRDDDEDSAQAVFDNFVKNIIAYTQKTGDIDKFKEVAKLLAQEGNKRYVDQLFIAYKKFLADNGAPLSEAMRLLEIADEYLSDGQIEMAVVIYNHYIDYAVANYPQADAKLAMMVICDKFRDYGFAPALNADFAETIYAKAEKNFGQGVFTETEVLERALNLETLGDFEAAEEEYKYFIKQFGQSPYLGEAYCRLGIINIFYLGQVKQGENYLAQITEQLPDSDYSDFAAYYSGLIRQRQEDKQNALTLYKKVKPGSKHLFEQAQKRREEIEADKPLAEDTAYPLELLFDQQDSSVAMSLESVPGRAFTGQPVSWSGTAQDFSVGTVQPFFRYEWFWDKGTNQNPAGVTAFETNYAEAGPKLISLTAKTAGAENAVCRSLWVHEIELISPAQILAGDTVEFDARIKPVSPQEKDMHWNWTFKSKGTPVIAKEKKFSHVFDEAGDYEAELVIDIKGAEFKKKFSFKVTE